MNDSALIQVIENILLTPASDFYLSTILHDPSGNALDPRTVDTADLGTTTFAGIAVGLVVRNLTVRGMSNVQIIFDGDGNPEIDVDGNTVTFHAELPNDQPGYIRPDDVPSQIEGGGELDVTIAGQAMPPGQLSLSIVTVQDITGVFTATEDVNGDPSTVEIGFTALSVNPVLSPGNLTIDVTLGTVFEPTINAVLAEPSVQQSLLDQINEKLADPDLLSSLSQIATAEARQALSAQ